MKKLIGASKLLVITVLLVCLGVLSTGTTTARFEYEVEPVSGSIEVGVFGPVIFENTSWSGPDATLYQLRLAPLKKTVTMSGLKGSLATYLRVSFVCEWRYRGQMVALPLDQVVMTVSKASDQAGALTPLVHDNSAVDGAYYFYEMTDTGAKDIVIRQGDSLMFDINLSLVTPLPSAFNTYLTGSNPTQLQYSVFMYYEVVPAIPNVYSGWHYFG